MTDDLVARLRNEEHWTIGLCDKAADEIERLQAEQRAATDDAFKFCAKLQDAEAEIVRLRAALRCAHQAADDVYKRLMPKIARKDAALREYGGHRQACYYHMGHGCNCGWSAALAPTQEKTND